MLCFDEFRVHYIPRVAPHCSTYEQCVSFILCCSSYVFLLLLLLRGLYCVCDAKISGEQSPRQPDMIEL